MTPFERNHRTRVAALTGFATGDFSRFDQIIEETWQDAVAAASKSDDADGNGGSGDRFGVDPQGPEA